MNISAYNPFAAKKAGVEGKSVFESTKENFAQMSALRKVAVIAVPVLAISAAVIGAATAFSLIATPIGAGIAIGLAGALIVATAAAVLLKNRAPVAPPAGIIQTMRANPGKVILGCATLLAVGALAYYMSQTSGQPTASNPAPTQTPSAPQPSPEPMPAASTTQQTPAPTPGQPPVVVTKSGPEPMPAASTTQQTPAPTSGQPPVVVTKPSPAPMPAASTPKPTPAPTQTSTTPQQTSVPTSRRPTGVTQPSPAPMPAASTTNEKQEKPLYMVALYALTGAAIGGSLTGASIYCYKRWAAAQPAVQQPLGLMDRTAVALAPLIDLWSRVLGAPARP